MYLPAAFVESRPEVVAAFLVDHPMAQLVTMSGTGLVATPLPMLYEPAVDGMGSLVGHVARANTQWSATDPAIEALAIFTGANAYVSPNWYPSKHEHGKVVPTWNYESVHVRGTFVVHDDRDWKLALVTRLTDRHESMLPTRWAVADAPPDYIDSMLKAIVGIEVRITAIQAKRKLSQNRSAHDIAGTIDGLAEIGGDSARVADAMRTPWSSAADRPSAVVEERPLQQSLSSAHELCRCRVAEEHRSDKVGPAQCQPRSGQRRFWRRRTPALPSLRCSASAHCLRQPL